MARHDPRNDDHDGGAVPSGERLLQAIPGVALLLDTEGVPADWNGPAGELLGLRDRPVPLAELVRPAHRKRVREALGTVGDTGSASTTLGLLPAGPDGATGRPRPHEVEFSRLDGEDSQGAAVLAVGQPVDGTGPSAGESRAAHGDVPRAAQGDSAGTAAGDAPAHPGGSDPPAAGPDPSTDGWQGPLDEGGVVGTLGDGAYAVDADRRVVAVDDGLLSTLGYGRDEVVGARLRELLPGEHQAVAVGFHEGLLSGDREEGTVEVGFLTADGGELPAEVHAAASDGTVVGVLRDVSDRQRRERQLAHHRDQLATLNRISEAVEEVVQGVVDSATREGIERAVCERLADSDLYRTVWIGRSGPGTAVEPAVTVGSAAGFHPTPGAASGEDGERDDGGGARTDLAAADYERSASVALRTGEPCVRGSGWLADAPAAVRRRAAERGIRSSMALPITHNDTTYGVLVLYSPRGTAFSDREQAALERLARVVGFAIHAADTEHLLRSGAATELEFRVTAADSFLAGLSRVGDCELRWTAPDGEEGLRHYVEVAAPAETVVEAAASLGAAEVAVVSERPGADEEGCIVEARVADSVAARLAEAGGVVHAAHASDGVGEFTARIAGQTDTRTVVEAFLETHEATLAAKRRVEEPVRTVRDLRRAAAERLTDRQAAVLRTAYLMGYFEWPREHTAEEVAERMEITSATLHYHLRAAERGFLELFFEDSPSGERPATGN